jgi:hypothetical protein
MSLFVRTKAGRCQQDGHIRAICALVVDISERLEFLIKFYNFIYPYNNSSYQSHRKM